MTDLTQYNTPSFYWSNFSLWKWKSPWLFHVDLPWLLFLKQTYNISNYYSNVTYSKIKHDSVRDLDHHSCDPIIPHTLTSQTIKRYITYTLLKQVHIILTIRLVANYKFIYYLKTFHIYTVVNVVCKIYKF